MSTQNPAEGCMWVKIGQLIQPTDFTITASGAKVLAVSIRVEWTECVSEFTWHRPRRQHPDIPFIRSRTLKAAEGSPPVDQQKAIFEIHELTRKYADAMTAIWERLDAMREGK